MSETSKDIRKLATLLEISKALSATLNLKTALQDVLETLARQHGAFVSVVAISNADSRQLKVEAAACSRRTRISARSCASVTTSRG